MRRFGDTYPHSHHSSDSSDGHASPAQSLCQRPSCSPRNALDVINASIDTSYEQLRWQPLYGRGHKHHQIPQFCLDMTFCLEIYGLNMPQWLFFLHVPPWYFQSKGLQKAGHGRFAELAACKFASEKSTTSWSNQSSFNPSTRSNADPPYHGILAYADQLLPPNTT